jgi:hypothetical protein
MPPVGERCIYTDADLEIDEENRYTITTCFDGKLYNILITYTST